MADSPTRKKKLRGGKIDFHGYITPEMYEQIAKFRDPDAGDRWESALLRRIIREWLAWKSQTGGGSGGLAGGRPDGGGNGERKEEPPIQHHSGVPITEDSVIIDRRPRALRRRGVL